MGEKTIVNDGESITEFDAENLRTDKEKRRDGVIRGRYPQRRLGSERGYPETKERPAQSERPAVKPETGSDKTEP